MHKRAKLEELAQRVATAIAKVEKDCGREYRFNVGLLTQRPDDQDRYRTLREDCADILKEIERLDRQRERRFKKRLDKALNQGGNIKPIE